MGGRRQIACLIHTILLLACLLCDWGEDQGVVQVLAVGPPDPQCKRGLPVRGACCKKVCGKCGGAGCYQRSKMFKTRCCAAGIKAAKVPFCSQTGAPCRLSGSGGGNSNNGGGGTSVSTLSGKWRLAPVKSGQLIGRHEACSVMANGRVYLIGGRGQNKYTSIYNPLTQTWSYGASPGRNVELHHMQCVVAGGKIWVVASWKGDYPREQNNDKVYVYDIKSDKWSTRPGMPANRRRGGAAAVVKGNLIYVVAGNRGGHGSHATSLSYMDAFNWKTGRWVGTKYPDMPGGGRDHVGGALVNGQLCIAGGRNGGVDNFFNAVLTTTYCYNFGARRWLKKSNIPQGRAGSATGSTCDGRLMIAGGEGFGKAFKRVDVFNGFSWKRAPDLVTGRHGSGLAVASCSCGQIFIPSGSPIQGGGSLMSTGQYLPNKAKSSCTKY